MVPATLGISVDQLNAFVDTICASFLMEGSITALYYSNRVMQLPLALFGIALSQVSLPAMSAHVARGETQEVKDTLNFALRLTLFMIVPATVGLLILGRPIIEVLFQHGEFSTFATTLTNRALFFFSLGLFAYAAVKILASAFYAHQNTRIPVMVAGLCVSINIAMNLLLMKRMGVGGLALATATASWVNAGALYYLLRRKLGDLGGLRILLTMAKAVLASAGMGVFCRFTMTSINFQSRHIPLILLLTIAIAGGAMVYMAGAKLLRMEEWEPFWAQMARRKK
jgi:putative peptidoglycan lipid II flippase